MSETTTAISKRDDQIQTVEQFLKANEGRLKEELSASIDPKQLMRVVLAIVRKSDTLPACTPESLLNAMIQAGQLGLEPTGRYGGAWLVPFKNKTSGLVEAQMIPDYRGLLAIARRSGEVESIEAEIICANDKYDYQRGAAPKIDHWPELAGDRGAFLAAYAVAWLKGARHPQIAMMNKLEIDAIRNRSKAANAGPWVTDYERMALKTVIRRLCGLLPGSTEMRVALQADDDVIDHEMIDTSRQPRRGVTGLGNRLKVVTDPPAAGSSARPAAGPGAVDAEVVTEPTEEEKQKAAAVLKDLAAAVRSGAEYRKVNGAWLKAKIKARGGSILMTPDGKLDVAAQPEAMLRGLLDDLEAEPPPEA